MLIRQPQDEQSTHMNNSFILTGRGPIYKWFLNIYKSGTFLCIIKLHLQVVELFVYGSSMPTGRRPICKQFHEDLQVINLPMYDQLTPTSCKPAHIWLINIYRLQNCPCLTYKHLHIVYLSMFDPICLDQSVVIINTLLGDYISSMIVL